MTALSLTDLNTQINGEPRILDTRLATALGFDRPYDIRKILTRHGGALERLGDLKAERYSYRGKTLSRFWLTEKQALYLCTKSQAEKAIEVTIRMVELFYQVRHGMLSDPRADEAAHAHCQETKRQAYHVANKVLALYGMIEALPMVPSTKSILGSFTRELEFDARTVSSRVGDQRIVTLL